MLILSTVAIPPLAEFARELRLPFPALSDVTGEIHRAFGLGRGLAIGWRTPVEFLRLAWQAKRIFRTVGDALQIGGDFIVDGAGIVR